MKKLLVATLIATTSTLVVLPAVPAMAAVGTISQDKPTQAENGKPEKDKANDKSQGEAKKAKKAKKAKPATAGQAKKGRTSPPGVGAHGRSRAPGEADSDKVTICHRTNADNNPYVKITPAAAGVANGHEGHEGPIYTSALKTAGVKWGDIIPPYEFRGVRYPGQNWTTEGRALFYNDCRLPNEVAGASVRLAAGLPAVEPESCENDARMDLPPAGAGCSKVAGVTAASTGDETKLAEDDSLLPNTGGLAWWLLVIAGTLVAAGAAMTARSRWRA